MISSYKKTTNSVKKYFFKTALSLVIIILLVICAGLGKINNIITEAHNEFKDWLLQMPDNGRTNLPDKGVNFDWRGPSCRLGGYKAPLGPSTIDCKTWCSVPFMMAGEDKSKDPELAGSHARWEAIRLLKPALVKPEDHGQRLEGWKKKYDNQAPGVPKSGYGSTLGNTINAREALHNIVDLIKSTLGKDVITLLDSSCGDMTWMPSFLQMRVDVDYTGYDITPANIQDAVRRFGNTTWKFKQHDLVKTAINKPFDLILNRHTAIHLGLRDGIQMFHNFVNSGSEFLVTTTFPGKRVNTELPYREGIVDRMWHEVNLNLYPFYFPTPLCTTEDTTSTQHIALWQIKSLQMFVNKTKSKVVPFST